MKYTTKIYTATLSALMLCAGTTSCSLLDEEIDEVAAHDENVNVNFAFSLNNTSTPSTRLTADMVQSTDGAFRGLSEIYVYPFSVRDRKIQSGDLPKLADINSIGALTEATANNARYYFYENQWFMTGVSSFMVYARGNRANLGLTPTNAQIITNRSTYGYLDHPDFVSEMKPSDIWFAPMQIRNVDTAPTEANALAQYLTNIANAWVTIQTSPGVYTPYRWSTETQPHLRAYYLNFISLTNTYSTRLMAGSSANVECLVSELHKLIRTLKETTFTAADNWNATVHPALCDEILAQIESATYAAVSGDDVTLIGAYHNYPGSYGLPDGAAALKWNVSDSKFEPQTITTSIANINTLSRFAYPAELFYYANSLIKTSNIDSRKTYYPNSTAESWEQMLAHYENNKASVTGNTQAIALIDPLQYGVAHLEVKLKKTNASTLKDANNADVTVEDGKFPLTALVIGGQRKVTFDFTQADPSSDTDVRFVYDHSFESTPIALSYTTETSASVHSLLLQSADNQKVPIVAEFQNNTTTTFRGVDGVIYPGTHFYLVGEIDPATGTGTDDAAKNRVFTQDYTTSITITVPSLAKAYNVLPNLLSPRLEIGIELMPWEQSTPGNVPLD